MPPPGGHIKWWMTLPARLVTLGQLGGRSRNEIEAVIGTPVLVSYLGGGVTIARWVKDGHYADLLFDDAGYCGGIAMQGRV